jgi:BirA family transcriptional regulator, biotin operon repressor / biotin---[acetyl-CoA-carboxylase] ligase
VPNRWSDLERPPLVARDLEAALVGPDQLWSQLRVVEETGSTNADLIAAAATAPDGSVLVAEAQVAGQGRLDRRWVSPARSGLTFSVLLRPSVPVASWGWLPLVAGLAVLRALRRLAEVEVALKWPNDVLLGPDRHKAAGILAQAAGPAVVIGVGLNVSTRPEELPRADATSLVIAGAACTDRDPLLRAILRQLAAEYTGWQAASGDPMLCGLHAAYTDACDTLGREVAVMLPGGERLAGIATGIDADGRLVVRARDGGQRTVAAGDVTHVR